MNSDRAQFSQDGFRLPWFGKQTGLTAISPDAVNENIMRPLRPLGQIQIKRGKEDKAIYSDGCLILQIKEEASTASGGIPGLPWQISVVDDTTIQVSAGFAFASGLPGRGARELGPVFTSTNTDTNITITAGQLTEVWMKIYFDGSDSVAEVNHSVYTGIKPETGWYEYPAPQFFDQDWPTPFETAYVRIGFVSTTVSPPVVTQELFDNPKILDFTADRRVMGVEEWTSGAGYRLGFQVLHDDLLYQRTGLVYGANGNEPGTSPSDWLQLTFPP